MNGSMTIGQAARASGVSAKMMRYYEALGLLGPVARSPAGYREYGQADVHRLRFIRRARDLGFALADIQALLDLWRDQQRRSADVKRIAQQHIDALDARIETLAQMRQTLQTLVTHCAGNDRPECPILSGLEKAPESLLVCQKSAKIR